jgi:hypothetical protein
MTADRKLPRLVYIGDVPIESSYHGSLLLYRLFSGYPPEKLLIIETDLAPSQPERRLPNVQYRKLAVPMSRLARSRFSTLYSIWLFLFAPRRVRRALRAIQDFHPEAIISVAHGYHWITAAHLAKRLAIPFHLISHDNILQAAVLPTRLHLSLDSTFGSVYRQAQSRLCVSPYMETEYSKRYGVAGTVLYPSRSSDRPKWEDPPQRDPESRRLRIAFAGSINSGGYARLLRLLAESLETSDEFVLFGPHTSESMEYWSLGVESIRVGGLLPPIELLQRLRQDFDVLFVPMPFDVAGHADNMRLSFPSKIADYTATGLPLLICGPEYCSAVHWARRYAPIAEVVTSEFGYELKPAVSRLRASEHRKLLGRRALEIGAQLFSHDLAESTLHAALTNS